MSGKKDLPSKPQASILAFIWSAPGSNGLTTLAAPGSGGYIDPTRQAIIKRGWLAATEMPGRPYPNGTPTSRYTITPAGFRALSNFFARLG